MRLMRIAFMRRVAHSAPKTSRFIAVLRFMAMIMIVHHAAFTPNRAEGILPPARSSFITACAFSLMPQRSALPTNECVARHRQTIGDQAEEFIAPSSAKLLRVGNGNGAVTCGGSSWE